MDETKAAQPAMKRRLNVPDSGAGFWHPQKPIL